MLFMSKMIYYSISFVKWEIPGKMTLLESMRRLDEADFRVRGRCRHMASEIAVITVCSIISGWTSLMVRPRRSISAVSGQHSVIGIIRH